MLAGDKKTRALSCTSSNSSSRAIIFCLAASKAAWSPSRIAVWTSYRYRLPRRSVRTAFAIISTLRSKSFSALKLRTLNCAPAKLPTKAATAVITAPMIVAFIFSSPEHGEEHGQDEHPAPQQRRGVLDGGQDAAHDARGGQDAPLDP